MYLGTEVRKYRSSLNLERTKYQLGCVLSLSFCPKKSSHRLFDNLSGLDVTYLTPSPLGIQPHWSWVLKILGDFIASTYTWVDSSSQGTASLMCAVSPCKTELMLVPHVLYPPVKQMLVSHGNLILCRTCTWKYHMHVLSMKYGDGWRSRSSKSFTGTYPISVPVYLWLIKQLV